MKTSRDIQKLINAIDQGVDVYSGMLRHNRVRMYLKEALQIAEVIEGELNTSNNRIYELQSALSCNRQHYDMQTKSFETLRAENALLIDRVKELEQENSVSRLRANLMWEELSAIKESKTIYVRRCK